MWKMRYLLLLLLAVNICCAQKQSVQGKVAIKRDIIFTNDSLKLAGTIFIPQSDKPVPAIVMTHGSGRGGRHLRGYQYMARVFSELGFATFIFDKRGIGESEGEYVESTDMNIPAGDLLAAVEVVKSQPEVDQSRIGVMGISQGGWIGPLATSKSDDIAFVIAIVGSGVSVRDQVLHHRKSELIESGWATLKIDSAITFARRLYTYLGSGIGYDELKDDYIQKARSSEWFSFIRAEGFGDELVSPNSLKHPWFKSLKYDPREAEEKINVPFLAILGENDRHVPTAQVKRRLIETFTNSGFKDYKIVVLPNEGHNSFKVENGQVSFRYSFKKPLFGWLQQFL